MFANTDGRRHCIKDSVGYFGGRRENKMINKLHMAMIGLYHGDAKRMQHLCKVHSYAKLIAEMENVDAKTLFILETAALTHHIVIDLW